MIKGMNGYLVVKIIKQELSDFGIETPEETNIDKGVVVHSDSEIKEGSTVYFPRYGGWIIDDNQKFIHKDELIGQESDEDAI